MGNAWCEGSEITYARRASRGQRVESGYELAGTVSVEVTLVEASSVDAGAHDDDGGHGGRWRRCRAT
jgi:hypothetical protein